MNPLERLHSLYDHGSNVEIDANIPLKRYFRSGNEMLKMAAVYEEEGNMESSYLLYIRYITLFLNKAREHPEFAKYPPAERNLVRKKIKDAFPKAEFFKANLLKQYEEEYTKIVAHQKELEEELSLENDKKRKLKNEKEEISDNFMEYAHDAKLDISIAPYARNITDDPALCNLNYPTDLLAENSNQLPSIDHHNKPSAFSGEATYAFVPSRDLKPQPSSSAPSVNRGTKPQSLLSTNHDQKEGRLRPIFIPKMLMETFLILAFPNTSKEVETCGILAGKLSLNKFVVTHLLIPKQVGTSDSCTAQHEEELFEQQDKFDLITLGWIHTHPTQTAFLSSVDLHTHCSYQLMLPEAVAIVCAPKFQETGFFTLTQSHGLNYIASCRQSGFHQHPKEPPLFTEAEHVHLDTSLRIEVVDLRR